MSGPGIAIIGLGNWGRNHVRAFAGCADCRIQYLFDADTKALEAMRRQYPHLAAAENVKQIFTDGQVQAVVIATPAVTHYDLARAALEAGKDVFLEKPMALGVGHCEELCELADRGRSIIQVGHLLLFHPAIQYLKGMIDRGELGDVHYIYSQRLNLGVVRADENSLWSLAPHDISLANFLLAGSPSSVKATGGSYLRKGIEDVIFLNLTYPDGRIANIHVSWLDPHKIRRLTIVGSRRMAVFDDMETTEKVRIYDKGFSRLDYENYGELLSVRMGDILIPSIPNTEPLRLQALHFLDCIQTRKTPLTDGRQGLDIVKTLSEASKELAKA